MQVPHMTSWNQDKAAVALANKNARIVWALLTREKGFDAKHVSLRVAA